MSFKMMNNIITAIRMSSAIKQKYTRVEGTDITDKCNVRPPKNENLLFLPKKSL